MLASARRRRRRPRVYPAGLNGIRWTPMAAARTRPRLGHAGLGVSAAWPHSKGPGARPQPKRSEHRIGVGRGLWNRLDGIPVLDDLAVFQPEDVDDGVSAGAWLPHRMDMQDHEVAIDQRPLDLAVRLRIFLTQETDELAETIRAVRRIGVVLDVAITDELERSLRILLVQARLIEAEAGLPIRFFPRGMRLSVRDGRHDRPCKRQGRDQGLHHHGYSFSNSNGWIARV